MDEYALITYNEVKILLEIGSNNSFFPISELIRPLAFLPEYIEGVANLDGTISVVLDLASFLGITYRSNENMENLVFLQVNHPNGDFVLKVPLPKIINEEIKFKAIGGSDNLSMKIPSARYYAVNKETYLVIVIDDFVDFLANELSDILFSKWLSTAPLWNQDTTLNAVPNQKTESLGSVVRSDISKSTKVVSENILAFEVGNNIFLLEEKNVTDIVVDEIPVTRVPNSIYWMRGVLYYQNEAMVAIDLAKYLDIQEKENLGLDLICKGSEGGFVINAKNVRSVNKDILNPVFMNEYDNIEFPYTNIFSDDEKNVYYQLNVRSIEKSLREMVKTTVEWKPWLNFFQKEKHVYEETDKYLMGELQSLNSLSAFIGKHQLLIPHERIDILQTNSRSRYFEGFRFTQHGSEWIPSIDLSKLYGEPSDSLLYNTVVKYDDMKLELRSEVAHMNYQEVKLVDDDLMKHIAPSSSEFGIANLNLTKTGYAFELNFDKVKDVVLKIKNENGKELAQVTKEINHRFKIPEIKDEEISDYITGMWDPNSKLFLFTELNNESRFAYSTENIKAFLYQVEEGQEIVSWEHEAKNDLFYYVQVSNSNGEDQTFQIPSSSYLRAVAQDSVKNDKEGGFISLKEERIPILSFP